MSLGRIENTIYGPHLVNPDRCVVPAPSRRGVIPGPKPFDAPPGMVPFHRALEAENLANRRGRYTGCPGAGTSKIHRPCDQVTLSEAARLLPKLGEILPASDAIE